ncbi:MAG: hypothetical protein RR224_01855 [Clostridia bacterium]
MAFCENCGKPLADRDAICPNCSAPVSSPASTEHTHSAISNTCPPKDSRYAPIGAWNLFGSFLLMGIPVAGPILTIVWACGGALNQNRRNLARAALLLYALFSILTTIIFFIILASTNTLEAISSI